MSDTSINFTKSAINALSTPASGRAEFKDAKTPGLHLRVSSSGVKTFSLFKRVNGKPERVTLGRFPELTVEQARRKAAEMNGKIAMGVSPSTEKRRAITAAKTLGEFFEDYVAVRKQLKASTITDMRRSFRETFPDWMKKPANQITSSMVQARHSKFGQEHSEARANLAMRYLRALFTFIAHHEPTLAGLQNPVAILTKTRGWFRVQRRNSLIKPHELGGWLKAIEQLESDWGDYFLFLLLTGLRREEALSLRWEDVDFIGKTFMVRDTKNHSDHELPITDGMFAILARRRLSTDGRATSEKVFVDAQGRTLSNYRYALNTIEKKSGVRVTPHDLRRTFASIAEGLDISGYSLKRLLNHTTSDVTQGYVILNIDRLRGLMERISRFVEEKS